MSTTKYRSMALHMWLFHLLLFLTVILRGTAVDVSDRIKSLIKERGFTQKRFADKVGLSQSFISELSSNKKTPNLDTLEIICNALNISLSDFFRPFDKSKPELAPYIETLLMHVAPLSREQVKLLSVLASQMNSPYDHETGAETALLPLLGAAAAGFPLNSEAFPDESILVPVKYADRSQFYAVSAIGDSMSPRINDGDYVIVRYDSEPSIHDVVLVRSDGIGADDYTIKVLRSTGRTVSLHSLNSNYAPLILPAESIHSMEKVVHIVHR
jgi:SOS-response transcriptional repressor LexA